MNLLGNHLWQCTVFGAAAAVLAFVFRKLNARIRCWIWLTASAKFLIPFSLIIAIVGSLDISLKHTAPAAPQTAIAYLENISQPFGVHSPAPIPAPAKPDGTDRITTALFAVWLSGSLTVLLFYMIRGKRLGLVLGRSKPLTDGRAFEQLRSLERNRGSKRRIRLACSDSSLEPGVFGVFRPTLLLPEGIVGRLSDSELEAIIAHEIAHVRRHDNLISALHMFAEALFWFHPMIWWLGAKLVEERERACDEEVLRMGKNPQSYAEGILKICEFCLQSPLRCVAGVTGRDMQKRVQAIMSHRTGGTLTRAKKLALTMAGIIALAFPVVLGLFKVPSGRAQSHFPVFIASGSQIDAGAGSDAQADTAPEVSGMSLNHRAIRAETGAKPAFEVVSIKTAESCGNTAPGVRLKIPGGTRYEPGGHYISCSQLIWIIMDAYQLDPFSKPTGGPGWIEDTLFQIEAKAEGNPGKDEMRLMVQSLLEQKFKLKMHRESRKGSVYLLTIADGGAKLQPAKDAQGNAVTSLPSDEELRKHREELKKGGAVSPGQLSFPGTYSIMMNPSGYEIMGKALSIGRLTDALFNMVGNHKVVDKTGLTGLYDINLVFANPFSRQSAPGAADSTQPTEPSAPVIFTAIREQLGLRLVPDNIPLEYTVIDSVGKPPEN